MSLWCKAYFDILNHSGLTHEFNSQRDEQTFPQQMKRLRTLRGQKIGRREK